MVVDVYTISLCPLWLQVETGVKLGFSCLWIQCVQDLPLYSVTKLACITDHRMSSSFTSSNGWTSTHFFIIVEGVIKNIHLIQLFRWSDSHTNINFEGLKTGTLNKCSITLWTASTCIIVRSFSSIICAVLIPYNFAAPLNVHDRTWFLFC